MKSLLEASAQVRKFTETKYQAFFQKAMKKFGIEKLSDLKDDEKKKFYDYVDRNWNSEDESGEDGVKEAKEKYSDKQIKMAFGILNDPRWKSGNMTAIVKKIEQIAKGLSKYPSVEKALRVTNESLEEGKSSTGYELYHKDFSSAMKHAYDFAKKKFGIEVDPKEIDDKVASGPRKPSKGKTNSYRLVGTDGKKAIQVQVFGMDNGKYELNMYKESVELEESPMVTFTVPNVTSDMASKLERIAKEKNIEYSRKGSTVVLKGKRIDMTMLRTKMGLAQTNIPMVPVKEEVELEESKVEKTYKEIMKGNRQGPPDDDEVGDYIPRGMTKKDMAKLIDMLAKQGYDKKFLTKDLAPLVQEDVELTEAVDPKKVVAYLVKKGSNPKDAEKMVAKNFKYATDKYSSASVAKIADVIMSLDEEVELTEESNTIAKVKEIVAKKSAQKIDGVMVDMFTASAIAQIYDKVNDTNKAKMDKLKISQLANVAFKMMKREEVEAMPEDSLMFEAVGNLAKQWMKGAKSIKVGDWELVRGNGGVNKILKKRVQFGDFSLDDDAGLWVANMKGMKGQWTGDSIDGLVAHLKKAHEEMTVCEECGKMHEGSCSEAVTESFKKASMELTKYAQKSGGMDKGDFLKVAKMLSDIGRADLMKKGTLLGKLSNTLRDMDTDPRDKVYEIIKGAGLMESLNEAVSTAVSIEPKEFEKVRDEIIALADKMSLDVSVAKDRSLVLDSGSRNAMKKLEQELKKMRVKYSIAD